MSGHKTGGSTREMFSLWDDINNQFKGNGMYRVLLEFVMLALTASLSFYVTFNDRERVPSVFDSYYIYQPKPYSELQTMFKDQVYSKNTITDWGDSAAHAAAMRTALNCDANNATTGVCGHCVDVYAGILHDASTTAAAVFADEDTDTVVTPIKREMLSCVFREFGQFGAQFAFFVNPWLHFFVWNFIMFVQAIAVQVWAPTGRLSLTALAKGVGVGITLLVFVVVFFICIFLPGARENAVYHVTTARFDLGSTLVLAVLAAAPGLLLWAFDYWNDQPFSRYGETAKLAAVDTSLIAAGIPITTIVACFAGWLEYSLLNYLYTTVLLLFALGALSDFVLVHINGNGTEIDTKNKSTPQVSKYRESLIIVRMQLWFVSIFVLVFMGFVYMPTIPAQDPYRFSSMVTLFTLYVIAITIASPLTTFMSNDPKHVSSSITTKIIVELAFRVTMFLFLFQLATDPYNS